MNKDHRNGMMQLCTALISCSGLINAPGWLYLPFIISVWKERISYLIQTTCEGNYFFSANSPNLISGLYGSKSPCPFCSSCSLLSFAFSWGFFLVLNVGLNCMAKFCLARCVFTQLGCEERCLSGLSTSLTLVGHFCSWAIDSGNCH